MHLHIDFIKLTSDLWYKFSFNGAIYYFKRGQSLKYQKFNKYNRKKYGGSCPQFSPP